MIAPCGGDIIGTWRGVTCGASIGSVEIEIWNPSTCGLVVSTRTYELEGTAALLLEADGSGTQQHHLLTSRDRFVIPRQCLTPGREEAHCEEWSLAPEDISGDYVVSGVQVCHLEHDCICESETDYAFPDQEFNWYVEDGNALVVSTWRGSVPFCVRPEGAVLDIGTEQAIAYEWLVREP